MADGILFQKIVLQEQKYYWLNKQAKVFSYLYNTE